VASGGDITNVNLGQSIRHGAKWLLAGNVASQALQFAFSVVLARLLVPADFGTLVTVQIFTGLAGFVSGGGMGQALIRAKETKLQDFQVVFTAQLALGLLVYAAFFFLAPAFSRWYDNPLYTDLFRVSAISFLLRPFFNMPNAWLSREMRFKQRSIIDVTCATISSVLSVVLAWQHFGVWSLVFGGLTGTVLSITVMFIATPVRPRLRFDAALARELGLYGIKVTSNDVVSYVRSQTPNFVLGVLQGPATVGLYNRAESLSRMPSIVSGSAYDSIFRGLAKTQEDKNTSRYIYFRTITLLTVYMLPIYVGFGWVAEPFIRTVYGAKWIEASIPLSILCFGGIFACIGHPSGAVLAANNWLGREIVVQATTTVLVAIACFVGIRWGLAGVAWGLLIAWAYSAISLNRLATRCLGATFKDLLSSLKPGLTLNVILYVALLTADRVVPSDLRVALPPVHLILITVIGFATYALSFLYLPIPALAKESAQWRSTLRLN
jgi:O-antigen/teichoic acid export membrane protein